MYGVRRAVLGDAARAVIMDCAKAELPKMFGTVEVVRSEVGIKQAVAIVNQALSLEYGYKQRPWHSLDFWVDHGAAYLRNDTGFIVRSQAVLAVYSLDDQRLQLRLYSNHPWSSYVLTVESWGEPTTEEGGE